MILPKNKFKTTYYQMWQSGLTLPFPVNSSFYIIEYKLNKNEKNQRLELLAENIQDAFERACFYVANKLNILPENVNVNAIFDSTGYRLWGHENENFSIEKYENIKNFNRREFLAKLGFASMAMLIDALPAISKAGTTTINLTGIASGFPTIFLSSTNWVCPVSGTYIAYLIGGGGGGGGGDSWHGGGGGGGGCGGITGVKVSLVAGSNYSIQVGSGGSGGSGGNGSGSGWYNCSAASSGSSGGDTKISLNGTTLTSINGNSVVALGATGGGGGKGYACVNQGGPGGYGGNGRFGGGGGGSGTNGGTGRRGAYEGLKAADGDSTGGSAGISQPTHLVLDTGITESYFSRYSTTSIPGYSNNNFGLYDSFYVPVYPQSNGHVIANGMNGGCSPSNSGGGGAGARGFLTGNYGAGGGGGGHDDSATPTPGNGANGTSGYIFLSPV